MSSSQGSIICMDFILPLLQTHSHTSMCLTMCPPMLPVPGLETWTLMKAPSVMNCLSHPHCAPALVQGPWIRPRNNGRGRMAAAGLKILFCFRFYFILDVLLLHGGLLEHASDESRLLPILLEFQDRQTHSKGTEGEL